MAYRLTFQLDPQTGRVKTPADQEAESGLLETGAQNDSGLADMLRPAREAASAYDPAPELRFDQPSRRRRQSAHARFVPRNRHQTAFRSRRWSAFDPFRSVINLPRLREVAFAALSIGITLGALLIAFVHGAAGNLAPPAQNQTGGAGAGIWSASGTAQAVTVNVAPAVAVSTSHAALVTPAISTLMYEGGEFATRARATAQVSDLRASGVRAFVSAAPPYLLLFAPVATSAANASLERYLRRAEAPYYMRSWTLPGRMLSLKGNGLNTVKQTEQAVVDDVRVLEGLLAVHAGYQAPLVGKWEQASTAAFGIIGGAEWHRLGVLGKQIRTFHAAVQSAFRAASAQLPGAAKNGGDSALLTGALTAYEAIGRK
ncbi:MAG: hypothetical protein ACYCYO_06330 [Bacilli bacterium]